MHEFLDIGDVVRLCGEVVGATSVTQESNFLDIGGDSLTAALLAVRLEERWNALVDVFTIIAAEDLREIHEAAVNAIRERSRQEVIGGRPAGPVSPSLNQAVRLRMDADAVASGSARPIHQLVFAFRACDGLDIGRLERAFHTLALRHEPLRSVFPSPDEVLVLDAAKVSLEVREIDDCADERVRAEIGAHMTVPFDLKTSPPWNVLVLRHHDTCAVVAVCLDHLLTDGEGIGILFHDLAQAYDTDKPLKSLSPGYYDWAHWQRTVQLPVAFEEAAHLTNEVNPGGALLPELSLVIDSDRGRSELGLVRWTLARPLVESLTAVAARRGCTLFQALFLTFGLTVDNLRRPGPIGIVTPVANRVRPETQQMVGWVSNMTFVPLAPDWTASFVEGLGQMVVGFAGVSVTSTVPVRVLQEHHWKANTPIVRAPGVFMDFRREEPARLHARGGRWRHVRVEVPGFLLPGVSLGARHRLDGAVEATLSYDRGRISHEQAQGILTALESLVEWVVARPDEPLRESYAQLASSVPGGNPSVYGGRER